MTDWPAWATEKVDVRPADLEWRERGEKERLLLEATLGAWLVVPIEHVGSTAVPNLSAKPILDFQAAVTNFDCAADIATALTPAGWHCVPPEIDVRTWRRFFVKVAQGHRVAHLHVMLLSNARWRQQLAFRDALRADPFSSNVTRPSRRISRCNTSPTVRRTPRARQTSLPPSWGRVAMTP
jgi:GrpB-like predicted nucleotidyltransferase (UPF0157 family)